jgi:hypothetical protein
VARKEDGFYIDPRTNGGINIEAISLDDVVITDGNGSVISRHAKRQNDASGEYSGETTENAAEESQDEGKADDKKEEESVTGEDKNRRRRRREVAASKDSNGSDSQKSDVQSVSTLGIYPYKKEVSLPHPIYIYIYIYSYLQRRYPKQQISGKTKTSHNEKQRG